MIESPLKKTNLMNFVTKFLFHWLTLVISLSTHSTKFTCIKITIFMRNNVQFFSVDLNENTFLSTISSSSVFITIK